MTLPVYLIGYCTVEVSSKLKGSTLDPQHCNFNGSCAVLLQSELLLHGTWNGKCEWQRHAPSHLSIFKQKVTAAILMPCWKMLGELLRIRQGVRWCRLTAGAPPAAFPSSGVLHRQSLMRPVTPIFMAAVSWFEKGKRGSWGPACREGRGWGGRGGGTASKDGKGSEGDTGWERKEVGMGQEVGNGMGSQAGTGSEIGKGSGEGVRSGGWAGSGAVVWSGDGAGSGVEQEVGQTIPCWVPRVPLVCQTRFPAPTCSLCCGSLLGPRASPQLET